MLSKNCENDPLLLLSAEERNEYLRGLLADEHADAGLTVRALNSWFTDRWLTAGTKPVVLTPDEDIYLYGSNLAHWVNAGGFKRWFENGQGDNLSEALHALEVLGAHDEALLLREAASVVTELKWTNLHVAYEMDWDTSVILSPSQDASLSDLDEAFSEMWNGEHNLNELLAAFARRRGIGPKPGSEAGPAPRPKPKRAPKPGPRGESKGWFGR